MPVTGVEEVDAPLGTHLSKADESDRLLSVFKAHWRSRFEAHGGSLNGA
jgi:hypothetical protein